MKMNRKTISILVSLLMICIAAVSAAQDKKIKTGLTKEDWAYKLADGVTSKEVTYYSDGVGCYAKIFFPKGFSTSGKTPESCSGKVGRALTFRLRNTPRDLQSADSSRWRSTIEDGAQATALSLNLSPRFPKATLNPPVTTSEQLMLNRMSF